MPPPPEQDPREGFAAARAAVALSWADPPAGGPGIASSPELAALVDAALAAPSPAGRLRATWLLLVALTGATPTLHEVEDAWLTLSTAGPADVIGAAVTTAAEPTRSRLSQCLGGTLVDVTVTAATSNYAGVPRVVRQLISAWGEPAGVHYVVWDALGFRTLNDAERAGLGLPPQAALAQSLAAGSWVVPYDATFVVVEVMRPEAHATAVEAMAYAGAVELRGLVYDLASLVETHPDAARGPFLHHLSALSRGSRVSAISDAVAADVSDYFSILRRNGRSAPPVSSHLLPDDPDGHGDLDDVVADLDATVRGDRAWPVVTVVSSLHRRKNHGRLLAACERLWDEGLTFRLLAIEGTGSRILALADAIDRLVEQGRPVTLLNHVSEPVLWAAYRLARVTAYVSLAEGYGLPIAESLAAGTPAVASGHGSMAELGAGGGVLLVDARDEDSIADGLRRALTDDAAYEELLAGVAARRQTTWQGYARSVGGFLGVVPEIEQDLRQDREHSGRTG